MRKLLMLGTALAAFGAAPAHAQYNTYAKDGEGIINQTQRMETNRPVERRAEARSQTQARQAARIEPAAGNRYDNNIGEDFTGPYIGGDVGYQMGTYDVTGGDVGLDGFNGGIFVGYGFDYNFIKWLGAYAGLELGYEWSESDGDMGVTGYEKDGAWLVTFRPGLSMHEDALTYGIIGYSRGQFEGNGDEEDLDGLVLGAGAQFDTNTPFKPRLEYTYTNYEDENLGGSGFDGHENNIKLGAVFQF